MAQKTEATELEVRWALGLYRSHQKYVDETLDELAGSCKNPPPIKQLQEENARHSKRDWGKLIHQMRGED